jgi:hypothetical protein
MIELIDNELSNWKMAKDNWLASGGNSMTYLELPVISFRLLNDINTYHKNARYDHLLPPLQVLGNLDKEGNSEKLLIISLEPLKNMSDFNLQYAYFFNLTNSSYGNNLLNYNNYLKYQIEYFRTFPNIINLPSPHARGSNKYWRYIDCLSNGYQNNPIMLSQNWDTLGNTIIDLPISPLWARSHPNFYPNQILTKLFIQKIKILKPKKILVLGKAKFDFIINLFNINVNNNFSLFSMNGNNPVYESNLNLNEYQFKIYFRRFFSNGGGSYEDAYNLGNMICNDN